MPVETLKCLLKCDFYTPAIFWENWGKLERERERRRVDFAEVAGRITSIREYRCEYLHTFTTILEPPRFRKRPYVNVSTTKSEGGECRKEKLEKCSV